jgi:RNA 3'-terminal phosphate cyclase (ATP)
LRDRGLEPDIALESWEGGPGSVIALTFDEAPVPTLFFGLGARGKPAEAVADEAADPAIAYAHADAPVDPHSADQILLPLAFAAGASEYRTSEVTRHLTTNITVVKYFIDREISCEGEEGSAGVVRVAAAPV